MTEHILYFNLPKQHFLLFTGGSLSQCECVFFSSLSPVPTSETQVLLMDVIRGPDSQTEAARRSTKVPPLTKRPHITAAAPPGARSSLNGGPRSPVTHASSTVFSYCNSCTWSSSREKSAAVIKRESRSVLAAGAMTHIPVKTCKHKEPSHFPVAGFQSRDASHYR